MATTDEDLQKKQQNVEDLRQKVADTNADRETIERGLANDITAEALDAEAARLEGELTEAKHLVKLAAGKDDTPAVVPVTPVVPFVPTAPAAIIK